MQQEGAEFRRRTTLAYSAAGVDKLLPGGSMSGSVSVPPPPSDTSLGQDEPKSDEDAERATWRNRNLPNPTGELLLEIQRQESGGSTPGGGVSLVTMGKVQSEIEQVLAEQATQSHAIAELTAGQATLKQEVRATLRGVEQILATMQAMQATQATNSTPVFSPGTPGTPSAAFARTPSGHLRGVASGLLVSATASRYLSGASLQGGADLREEWDGTEGRGTPVADLARIARGQTDIFNSGANSKITTSRVQVVGARLPLWRAGQKLPDPFAPLLSEQGVR
ncbi:hypothetical protein T484DRAFT_2123198 [Baffinella frigidus]|nr:hypothetical protein T484DRAFT_2123198 [Cryptophyta sp. CCMP2293]